MDYNAIPKQMREARRWLVWGRKKARGTQSVKSPYYVSGKARGLGGQLDAPDDLMQLATFEQAIEVDGYSGIGFALGPDGYGGVWQGIDLDGVPAAGLHDVALVLPGYVERSPSGHGLHAIGYGESFKNLGANGSGVEAYCGKRYFTVTGDFLWGDICCLADFTQQVLLPRHTSALHRDVEPQRRSDSDTQNLSNSGNPDRHEMGGWRFQTTVIRPQPG